MKVLLTDDSPTMRNIQKRILKDMGITDVVEAGDGAEALKKIIEHKFSFDFMLCDINMPIMSGIETLRRIRGNPKTALVTPNSVVLTDALARKYFGDEDPLGQQLVFDNDEYVVSGVIKNLPGNSHFTFPFLVSMSTFRTPNWVQDEWLESYQHYTYVVVSDNALLILSGHAS